MYMHCVPQFDPVVTVCQAQTASPLTEEEALILDAYRQLAAVQLM